MPNWKENFDNTFGIIGPTDLRRDQDVDSLVADFEKFIREEIITKLINEMPDWDTDTFNEQQKLRAKWLSDSKREEGE